MLKRKPDNNGGYDYKKAGDYVDVKPIKRKGKALDHAVTLKILTLIHWELVVEKGPVMVKEALEQAKEHGLYWYSITPKGDGSLVDYCEYVVHAAKHIKIINDIEWKLWFSNPHDDPRLIEFRRGFLEAKKEAEKKKVAKRKKRG